MLSALLWERFLELHPRYEAGCQCSECKKVRSEFLNRKANGMTPRQNHVTDDRLNSCRALGSG